MALAIALCTPALAKSRAAAEPQKPAQNQAPAQAEPPLDMSHAVPLDQSGTLPNTSTQYRNLQNQIRQQKPLVEGAKTKSEKLAEEARNLRQKLIDTAARVQQLEQEKASLDSAIAELVVEQGQMQASFNQDRIKVGRLLAVLERLQHDMPPVIVLKANDALGATHGAMLLGASLPRIYDAAAALSRRLETLRRTRKELQRRRVESARNAIKLSAARVELNQLLAIKEREAQAAQSAYGDLQSQLDAIAGQAADLGSLLAKVAALRAAMPASQSVVMVGPETASGGLARGALRRPVIGRMLSGKDVAGDNLSPGVIFVTGPFASVVAPADGRVLFAGPYHKTGQALILEIPGGYDLVLAGLDRIAVRTGDQLLAGEPVGTMPASNGGRLYFEVRKNGKSLSPAPWLEPDLRPDLRKAKKS
ncbi:MAG TPA: peptidoglycan DD-metalloendopeptidase family protein [Rhizomicrobium sp.]|nr:peptidoglycan DD-metalloendopeptidase family protein [Rhizomicrobium sp.]